VMRAAGSAPRLPGSRLCHLEVVYPRDVLDSQPQGVRA
jgi:hypothetical protein